MKKSHLSRCLTRNTCSSSALSHLERPPGISSFPQTAVPHAYTASDTTYMFSYMTLYCRRAGQIILLPHVMLPSCCPSLVPKFQASRYPVSSVCGTLRTHHFSNLRWRWTASSAQLRINVHSIGHLVFHRTFFYPASTTRRRHGASEAQDLYRDGTRVSLP